MLPMCWAPCFGCTGKEAEDCKGSFPMGKMVLGFITHPWDFQSSLAGLEHTGKTGSRSLLWVVHPRTMASKVVVEQRSFLDHSHVVSLCTPWVQISNFFSLYQPSTLAVSSCMPLACLYLCQCVHICLSVALLVFKGPEFIWFHYHFPSLELYLFVFSPFLIIIYMRLGCMLEMKCEFDKAATALASNRGLKALNPLEKSRLSFFFFFLP